VPEPEAGSHASYARRTISTFSCDIAYSDRPTVSRACALLV
jgi:hypothetical protein